MYWYQNNANDVFRESLLTVNRFTPSSNLFNIEQLNACWDDNDHNNDDNSHDKDVYRTGFTMNLFFFNFGSRAKEWGSRAMRRASRAIRRGTRVRSAKGQGNPRPRKNILKSYHNIKHTFEWLKSIENSWEIEASIILLCLPQIL